MATCPKCDDRLLLPTVLTAGLSARGCHSCSGALLDLVGYRAWADQRGIDAASTEGGRDVSIDDTTKAVLCPNCTRIMTKFRVAPDAENRIDHCGACDAAWLDGGEWTQLENMGLRENLGSVFSEPWQRRLREADTWRMNDETLRERFGEDYDRIVDFKYWLQGRPDRQEILGWISAPLTDG